MPRAPQCEMLPEETFPGIRFHVARRTDER
jgi:hypothetical protein